MKNLAVDTSSSVCSVAIFEDDKLIDINSLDDGRTHSENLMPLMDELLKRNNIDIKEINLISVCVGPGSFTGIRIGVSAIKPIAEVLNVKVASVTSLETLARNVRGFAEENYVIVPLIDARNNQVYCGVFDSSYNSLEDYIADDINEVINKISKYDNIVFVGDGAVLHRDLLQAKINNARFIDNNKQSAEMTGLCGFDKFKKNDLVDSDSVVPLYLRKSQAERQKNNG